MSVEIFSDSNSSITLPVCDQCGWCEGDYMYTNTFSSCGQLQLDDPINWLWGCPESQNCCARVPDAYAGFVMPQIDPLYLSDYENQVPFCSDMPWQGTTYLGICEENNADGSCGEVGPCNDGSEPDICGFCFGEGMGYNMTLTNCTYEASVNDQWFKTCPLSEPCCGAVSFLGLGPYSDESTPFCSSFTLDGVDYSGVCYKPDVCGICGGDNTSCFLGDNSLQDGYFGPINAPSGASGFDGIPWQPQLIDNSLNVFYDYGVLYDPFNPDECTFPVLGGYDTVILNDWSLHVQSDKCRGVGYTPGSQHAITGGITIYNEFSQKQKVITLDGVYSSSKYYNGNLTTDLAQNSTDLDYLRNMNNHHSVWPMQNGNFLLMGTHKISYTDWEILGGTDIENLTGTDDDMFEPGFFIEVKPDNIEDCTQDESGFFICDSSIVFEWYMVDHFVQDTLSNADACSSYPYMEEESGCYAPTAEIYKYPHMLNINIPKEGQFDWAHLNTIHYTPSEGDGGFCPELDGCFVISSRTIGLGEFYVIGKTSGKIIWRCCNSENYNREQNPAVKTHAQHGVNWIPPGYPGEGNLIFLNNKHYYKKCIDITDPDECNSCSVDGFGHSNAYCYWVQGDGYPGSDGAGACLDGGGEYTDDCNRSAIVEIKPNYDISQDSSVPFLYDEIFIMDRIYGTFPSYYNNNNITLNTNDFSNSWSAEAEGGVFKMPNGNIFVSSQSQLEKFEVSDPYGVPQLMAMIPGNLPDYGQDPNNNSAVHGRSFKVIPTCTDPTADNYDPASEYMYHVDDGSCVGGESGTSTGAAVGITEFFLEPQSAEIPQWIELTNFSGAEVDIQGWTIQTIDNVSGGGGFAEQGTYTITPVIGGNTLLRTDNFSKFICDSDGEVFINPYICENHCGAECTNLTEGSRYLIISDTADNYNGIFADILSNEVDFTGTDFSATEKDANIGWSGFQLPTTSQLSSYFADDCPLDPTVDQSTGYHIVLRNHLGQTVHHLCIDAQFPDGWYSSTSPGHSYSYVTQAGFQNINDQFYWRGLNHSEYIQHGMFGLRSGGTDYSYYFNDILMDVGIMLFGEDPYNPITSPPYFGNFNKGTPLDTEIYNLMGEMFYDNCRDFNAYNYMCNPGQSGFDTPACPYGPSTTNPLPNWICGDEEDGLPYGTCCQYIVEIGCTQPQVDFQGELFPVNYHCTEEMLGDDLLDFCETLDGGETYIPRGGCSVFVCQSNMTRACDNLVHIGDGNYTSNNCTEWGDGNNINCVSISVDCVTDGSYPEEWNGIAATWCQYPVVLHFDSETVDQSSQTIDINIWNSIPIEGIDDIIITGMRADSLTLSSKLAGWTHNISVEPEEPNGSIPVTTITVDKGAAPSLTPVDDWGSLPDGSKWDCVVATYINNSIICDTSDTIITLHYLIEEEDISSNMTIGFNDNNVSITIPTIFDQPEPIDIYADKVITQSIVNLDCNGHPYIPFDEYQETVMDECGECVIPVYVNGFEIFGLDYAGMQATGTNGCWYSETGTADGGCLTDCDCCGCDGIPGSTEELDECGICGGDGIDDGACDCDGNVDLGCGCGEAGPSGCDNACGSTLEIDECGDCGGDGIDCPSGCSCDLNDTCTDGVASSGALSDCDGCSTCTECNYTTNTCDFGCDGAGEYCDGDPCIDFSCSEPTPSCDSSSGSAECVCNGTPDCQPECNGGWEDLGCGCGEAGPSGCDNACGSTLEDDVCNVCGGNGNTCCHNNSVPPCFVCNQDNGLVECNCVEDCAGDCGGSAVDDWCDNTCGTTGPVEDMCGVCDSDSSNDCVQDCASAWGGSDEEDMCTVCISPYDEISCDAWNPCIPPNTSCVGGLCYENWTSSCAPNFKFGAINTAVIPTEIDILINLEDDNEIFGTTSPLQIELSGATLFGLQYTGTIVGNNCGAPFFNNPGGSIYNIFTCTDSADTQVTGPASDQILIKLQIDHAVETDFSVSFNAADSEIYRFPGLTGLFTDYAPTYSATLNVVFGCMDSYSLDYNYLANVHIQTDCTYPKLEFTTFDFVYGVDPVSSLIPAQCNCKYPDINDCSTCLLTDIWGDAHTIYPSVEWESYNYGLSDYNYSISTSVSHDSNVELRKISRYVTIESSDPDVVLGCGDSDVELVCEFHNTSNHWWNQISYDISDNDTAESFHIFKTNDASAINYWSGDICHTDFSCPHNGYYTLIIEWPWNWWELTDPLTDSVMTEPRIRSITKFEVSTIGCTDSSSCNHNQSSQVSCNINGDDDDCCTYFDYFGSSCCTSDEMDGCLVCEDSTYPEYDGLDIYQPDNGDGDGKIYYYADADFDNLGCAIDFLELCIYENPGSYYVMEDQEPSATIWPNSDILTSISDAHCNCPDGMWNSQCDECVMIDCNDNVVSEMDYGAATIAVSQGSNLSIWDYVSNSPQCISASPYFGGSGICVTPTGGGSNVCYYINECGICSKNLFNTFFVTLGDTSTTLITALDYRDCNGVCFPSIHQPGGVLPDFEYDYALSDYGAYYDSMCAMCTTFDNESELFDECGECITGGGTTYNIYVVDYSFQSDDGNPLEINVGDKVRWTQIGDDTNVPHNVNAGNSGAGICDGCEDNPVLFCGPEPGCNAVLPGSGETWTFLHTFNVAGEYHYVCDPHSGFMTGDIVVSADSRSGNCLSSPGPIDNTIAPPYDDTCYVWVGGCFDCSGNNVGSGGISGLDACDNCGGDCYDSGGGHIICDESENNTYQLADCFGNCYEPALGQVQPVLDDFGGCCMGTSLVNLYPDFDLTSSGNGDCASTFDGCTGEIGFCSDFQGVSGGDLITPYCLRCDDDGATRCDDDTECPEGNYCSDSVTFYSANIPKICDGGGLTWPLGPYQFEQPSTSNIGELITEDRYYYQNAGDYCIGIGPDGCNDCWCAECNSDYNFNMDCGTVCGGPSIVDDCGLCYDPSVYTGEINSCWKCLDNYAENFDSSTGYDCSGDGPFPSGPDYSCCDYPSPELSALSFCKNDSGVSCDYENGGDTFCNDLGLGQCIFGMVVNDVLTDSINLAWTWDGPPNENRTDVFAQFEIKRDWPELYYCNSQAGRGYTDPDCLTFWGTGEDPSGACDVAGGDECVLNNWFVVNTAPLVALDGVDFQYYDDVFIGADLATVPENLVYRVDVIPFLSPSGSIYSEMSNEVEVVMVDIEASFSLSVVNQLGIEQNYFRYADSENNSTGGEERIWVKAEYSNIPLFQGGDFVIKFPEIDEEDRVFVFPTWSDGTDDHTDSSEYWFCPTPEGTVKAQFGEGSNGRFLDKYECETGCTGCQDGDSDDWNWDGCSLNCVSKFDVYFEITADIFNWTCGVNGDITLSPFYLYWPSGQDSQCGASVGWCADCGMTNGECELVVEIKQGCVDQPSFDSCYYGGACTCLTCPTLCGTCTIGPHTNETDCKNAGGDFTSHCDEWGGDIYVDPPPDECATLGFYDPRASWDDCSGEGESCDTTCCTWDSICLSGACTGPGAGCNSSCIYPARGCTDDGSRSDGYINNQGGTGSVMLETYKCADLSVQDACDDITSDSYQLYCYDFGQDDTCGCSGSECYPVCGGEDKVCGDQAWCNLSNTPADNYAIEATYDCNDCMYAGCLEPDAINYAVPCYDDGNNGCLNPIYGCGDPSWVCQNWISTGSESCVIPFDYSLRYIIEDQGQIGEPGQLDYGVSDNEGDPVLIRKVKPGNTGRLFLHLRGPEGWNCMGDDSGILFDTEPECLDYCGNFSTQETSGYDENVWIQLCGYLCCEADCNDEIEQISCDYNSPDCPDGKTCTPFGYWPSSFSGDCGGCVWKPYSDSVFYPSEEIGTQQTFYLTEGLLGEGAGWTVENDDGYQCSGDSGSTETICPSWEENMGPNTEGYVIPFDDYIDYGQYNIETTYGDLYPVEKQYNVKLSKKVCGYEVEVEKTLYVTYTRNDYTPDIECIQYYFDDDWVCWDDQIFLDVANSPYEYIFNIAIKEDLENELNPDGDLIDPYYIEMDWFSSTNNKGDLNVSLIPDSTLILISDVLITGRWTIEISLCQPAPPVGDYEDHWDSDPPSDLSLWYIGLLETCRETEFVVNVIDTRGPIGQIVSLITPSFGISPDTYIFNVVGNDGRDELVWASTDMVEGWDSLYSEDYSQFVSGGSIILPNPNQSGWASISSEGNEYNTVWKYEISLYKCLDSSCDENSGTAEILTGYPTEYSDWSYDSLTGFGPDSIPEAFLPPVDDQGQFDIDNPWTGRYICPEGSEYQGDYCGQDVTDGHGNNNYSSYCCETSTCDDGYECLGWLEDSCTNRCIGSATIVDGDSCTDPGENSDECGGDGDCIEGYGLCSCTGGGADDPECIPNPGENTVEDLIRGGHIHRFSTPGNYKIVCKAYDLYYSDSALIIGSGTSAGTAIEFFEVEYVIPIEQSIPSNYRPWQGINIPDNELANIGWNQENIERFDLDGRPQMGCFLYNVGDSNFIDLDGVPWDELIKDTPIDNDDWNLDYEDEADANEPKEDFFPDADVRTPLSLIGDAYYSSGKYSNLYRYYDKSLQPDEYYETRAPSEVQLFLYARSMPEPLPDHPFGERESVESFYSDESGDDNFNELYVWNLNWGDGSDPDYISDPKRLGNGVVLRHTYERPGFYNIVGIMFRMRKRYDSTNLGEDRHHRFVININLNKDLEYYNEFNVVGGGGYTYIPYNESLPLVGGISEWSLYSSIIKRNLGYVGGEDAAAYSLTFNNYGDKLDAEYALAQIDEKFIGSEISSFTGSYASNISDYISDSDDINVYSYTSPSQVSANLHNGFFSGSVDGGGILQLDPIPTLIGYGKYQEVGELGNHIGEADIGRTRYISEPLSMWELVGFDSIDAGIPNNIRYWKNIIPDTYLLTDRQGVEIIDQTIIIDENDLQTWTGINEYGVGYYYPVLPRLNEYGIFDQQNEDGIWKFGLELQGDGYIPFGTPDRLWNEDDLDAPITNDFYSNRNLELDIPMDKISESSVEDKSGNAYVGVIIGDYNITYDKVTRVPDREEIINEAVIGSDEDKKYN